MTSRQDWPKPDLLQQRRLELGLPLEPAHSSEPLSNLLLKGAIFGTTLLMIPMLMLPFLVNQERRLNAKVLELASVEVLAKDAEVKLKEMAKELVSINKETKHLATELVSTRSGSALLEQMRQVTPQRVRLLSVAAFPLKLIIKGEAGGSDSLERINSLVLNLEEQKELMADGTSILKATMNDSGLIGFILESKIDSSVRVTAKRLRDLGSEGLARRFELLQSQGFAL